MHSLHQRWETAAIIANSPPPHTHTHKRPHQNFGPPFDPPLYLTANFQHHYLGWRAQIHWANTSPASINCISVFCCFLCQLIAIRATPHFVSFLQVVLNWLKSCVVVFHFDFQLQLEKMGKKGSYMFVLLTACVLLLHPCTITPLLPSEKGLQRCFKTRLHPSKLITSSEKHS